MVAQATRDKLGEYDTPTICNVIELFEVRPRNTGYVRNNRIRANYPGLPPVVGHAATCTARSAVPPPPGGTGGYSWLEAQIEQFSTLSGPPMVVIQDLDEQPTAGNFGEVMCTVYKTFGARGLITNGPGRDIEQVGRLGGFQVFTDGAVCSHGYFRLTSLYEPVEIGGLAIMPDDLLHADADGITQIPADIADEVADAAAEFLESERVFFEAIQGEGITLGQFKAARAESKALQAKLRDRLTRKG